MKWAPGKRKHGTILWCRRVEASNFINQHVRMIMKNNLRIAAVFSAIMSSFLFGLLLSGCGQEKKMEPVAVGEMEEYRDPGIGFRIKHPAGWLINAEVGRARFYNAPEVDKKFLDPTGAYPVGVEISVDARRSTDPAGDLNRMKQELGQQVTAKPEETATVAGKAAARIPFVANYGKGNIIHGHHIFLESDSIVYEIGFAGFGNTYEAYAAVFDASLNSLVLAKPVEKGRDQTLPSETFTEYDAKMFTFEYPENFNFTNPPKGKNDIVVGLRGVRQDCNILIDVFGAQGLSLDKVVAQNKGKYKGASQGKATIGGEPAVTLTLSATKDVDRMVYFAVKNDKVIRITMDWFRPQREEYTAAYNKVINSFKFK